MLLIEWRPSTYRFNLRYGEPIIDPSHDLEGESCFILPTGAGHEAFGLAGGLWLRHDENEVKEIVRIHREFVWILQ